MKRKDDKQVNFRITRDLHKQARIKAAQEGRPLSEVLREIIEKWTREKSPQK